MGFRSETAKRLPHQAGTAVDAEAERSIAVDLLVLGVGDVVKPQCQLHAIIDLVAIAEVEQRVGRQDLRAGVEAVAEVQELQRRRGLLLHPEPGVAQRPFVAWAAEELGAGIEIERVIERIAGRQRVEIVDRPHASQFHTTAAGLANILQGERVEVEDDQVLEIVAIIGGIEPPGVFDQLLPPPHIPAFAALGAKVRIAEGEQVFGQGRLAKAGADGAM